MYVYTDTEIHFSPLVRKVILNMIKNVLFDLDGTLTDPKIGITKSVAYSLNKFNINVNDLDELEKFIGPPLKNSFMDFYNMSENDAVTAVSYYREYFSDKGLFENTVYKGIVELLTKLKSLDKTLIIATSKPTVYAKKILEHFGLIDYFDCVCGSELDGTRSDKAEVISYALSQNNISSLNNTIMIGDRKHDIIGAKKIEIKSVGVLYGYGDFDELNNAGADYICADVNELSSLIVSL